MQVLPDRKTGAETDIKDIAAVHRQCRLWVKSRQTGQRLNPSVVRFTPNRRQKPGTASLSAMCQKPTFEAATNFNRPALDFCPRLVRSSPDIQHLIATPRTAASGHNRNCGRNKEA